jgi:hypothetical protein
MIIDTHAQLGIAATDELDETMKLHADIFGIKEFASTLEGNIADMDAAEVDKSVVVAIDTETVTGTKVSNEAVAAAVAKYPDRLIGFASVDPHKGVLAVRELENAVNDLGLKGLKFIPHLLELRPNDQMFYPIFAKAQELGIPVLFHSGTQFHVGTRLKYCRPIDLDDVAVDFPELKIIIAHFGFPWFPEALAVVQRHRNVFFNIAGWAPRHIPEMVVTYMNTVLSSKALLGSDYPLIPRKRIMSELKGLPLKEESLRKITSDNPKRLLGIE